MLYDLDIDTNFDSSWTPEHGGKAIAFVIDDTVVYTMAAKNTFFNLLLNFDYVNDVEGRIVIDLSNLVLEDSSSKEGEYVINFTKNNQIIETISTKQEILNAILLSNPKLVILRPEVKKLGVEPGWKYVEGIFSRI